MIRYTTLSEDVLVVGEYQDDSYNGLVTINYPTHKFVGEVINNKKNGVGKTFYTNGDIYICNYTNDKIDTTNFQFIGDFEYKGEIRLTAESTDLSSVVEFHGKTGYLKTKYMTYVGGFNSGTFFGKGLLVFNQDNITINGFFIEDKLFGTCEIESDNFYYEGGISFSRLNGFGYLKGPTKEYYGIFLNNYLIYNYQFIENSECRLCNKTSRCCILECGHTFHTECLQNDLTERNKEPHIKHMDNNCPTCEKPIFDLKKNYEESEIGLDLDKLFRETIF